MFPALKGPRITNPLCALGAPYWLSSSTRQGQSGNGPVPTGVFVTWPVTWHSSNRDTRRCSRRHVLKGYRGAMIVGGRGTADVVYVPSAVRYPPRQQCLHDGAVHVPDQLV